MCINVERRNRIVNCTVFLLLVFFTAAVPSSGQTTEKENLNRVIGALKDASAPGSPLRLEERPLLAEYGGFGSSLLVSAAREGGSSGGRFVLAVPLHAAFAVDSGIALARKLAERTGADGGNNGILIAFLGDEKNELPPDQGGLSHKGLRDLLALAEIPENWVVCYFDPGLEPEELIIRHGIRGYITPREIISPLPALCKAKNIPWSFRIRYNEIYKLELVEGPEPLSIIRGEEINGFVLSGADGSGKMQNEQSGLFSGENFLLEKAVTKDKLAELFIEFADSLEFSVIKGDTHYSAFSLPRGGVFFASEGFIITLALCVAGIILFLFLAYSVRHNVFIIFSFRLFFKYVWIFLIFLPLFIASIKLSSLVYSFLCSYFNISGTGPNYAGAGLIVMLAALFFFLPSPLLGMLYFPRRARFYGFSAIYFIVTGMIVAAFLDISYVLIFLWAFFFVFLGASFSSAAAVFLCALMVPLAAIGVLRNILETGDGRIADFFISFSFGFPSLWAPIHFALLSLPFFLLIKRGLILLKKSKNKGHEQKPKRKYRLIAVPVLIAALIGLMVIQIKSIPNAQFTPERRVVLAEIDTETEAAAKDGMLNISLDDIIFQDSRIVTLRLEARESPVRFDVLLESGSNFSLLPVYSAAVPFEREDEGKVIRFNLGEHPPNPLVMEIIVAKNFYGDIKAEALYNTNGYVLRVAGSKKLERQTR